MKGKILLICLKGSNRYRLENIATHKFCGLAKLAVRNVCWGDKPKKEHQMTVCMVCHASKDTFLICCFLKNARHRCSNLLKIENNIITSLYMLSLSFNTSLYKTVHKVSSVKRSSRYTIAYTRIIRQKQPSIYPFTFFGSTAPACIVPRLVVPSS